MHTTICPAEKHLEAIDKKVEKKRIPLSAHIDITYRCNLRCVHCYCQDLSKDFTGGRDEMSLEKILSVLDELADSGTLYLSFSGGEILTHPRFFDIARYARKNHFSMSFITNGTLIDENAAHRLTEFFPRSIQMSIYGITAGVHDSVTQVPGSFKKTVEAIRLLKNMRNKLILSTTVMKLNYHEAKDIPRFALSLGADRHMWASEITQKNDGSRSPQRYQIGADEMRRLHAALKSDDGNKEAPGDPLDSGLCAPGTTNLSISPYGDVYPCIQFIYPMGNVHEKRFADIWRGDSDVRREIRSVRKYADMTACRTCEYVRYCEKCIGIAYLETKDIRKCYNTLRTISKIECELRQNKGGGV